MIKNNIVRGIIGSLLLCFAIVQHSKADEPKYGIIKQSVINLRVNPGFESEMATQALLGTPVRVVASDDDWLKVETPEGYLSWGTESGVKIVSKQEYDAWNAAPKLMVTGYFTVVREKPSESSPVVADVVMGSLVKDLGKKKNYYKVELPNGKQAFLKKDQATPFDKWLNSRRPTAKNIIATARLFIGFPYFWGGLSPKGLDCSGFTKNCYYLNGVVLRRDAYQQAQTGDSVDISNGYDNLKPGDLLFFGSKKDGKPRVTHVGLYIGNGHFIHSSGIVHESSLLPDSPIYDAWNTGRLLLARRIIPEIDKDSNIVSIKKHPFYN